MKQQAKTKNIWTRLDDTGAIYGMTREDGETLASFKNRILYEGQYRSNSTVNGLENSLNSRFGYTLVRAISMDLKDSVDPTDYPYRAIFKTDDRFIICSRYLKSDDYIVDYAVELREKPYPTLAALVRKINENSSLYTASLVSTTTTSGYGSSNYLKIAKGFTLRNSTNIKTLSKTIPPSTVMSLGTGNVLLGTLIHSDTTALRNEVVSPDYLLNVPGNYYVDYENGIVYTTTLPAQAIVFKGSYLEEPFTLLHSPVSVSNLYSDEAKRYLLEEIEQTEYTGDSDLMQSGLPKHELIETVKEVDGKSRVVWGK